MKPYKQFFISIAIVIVAGCEIPEETKNLFFPPPDLYDPLVQFPVDLSQEFMKYEFTATHKYLGLHALEISVFNPQANTSFTTSANFRLTVMDANNTLIDTEIVEPARPYRHGDRQGVDLLFYTVPQDLPRGIPLHFVLIVTKSDPAMKSYDDLTLSLTKESDE